MSGRKRHLFDQTRALVRAALREGLTQDEVARLCRTQQSVVSQWANGKKKAYRHQIEPLLTQYGHLLNRAVFTDYLVADDDDESWESSAAYRLLAEWREANPEPPRPEKPDQPGPKGAQQAYEDEQTRRLEALKLLMNSDVFRQALPGFSPEASFSYGDYGTPGLLLAHAAIWWRTTACPIRILRVFGLRIFQHTFARPQWDKDRRRWHWSAHRRWNVHMDHGRFWLIDQRHRIVIPSRPLGEGRWDDRDYWNELPCPIGGARTDQRLLDAPDDPSRWSADAKHFDTHLELLDHIQSLIPGILETFGTHAAASVRASIRLALVRQGLSFDGVEVLTSPG